MTQSREDKEYSLGNFSTDVLDSSLLDEPTKLAATNIITCLTYIEENATLIAEANAAWHQWKNQNKLSYGTLYRRIRNNMTRAELRSDGIAGCLRTPKGGSSKQILVEAGFGRIRFRLLTPREYARLQGVKDQYILPDSVTDGYFAMGDAVCVPVIDWLSTKTTLLH